VIRQNADLTAAVTRVVLVLAKEGIMKVTPKTLALISRSLMRMKRSMILGTSNTMRMKSWTKLMLSLKPRVVGFPPRQDRILSFHRPI
jgi:hypothetical protein